MTNKNLIDLESMSVEQVDKLVRKARKIMQSPADFESATSANSITPAITVLYYT